MAIVTTLTLINSRSNKDLFASTPVSKELKENTKIRILIYDANGNKFTELVHDYKTKGTLGIKNVEVGKKYTIVMYSINSTERVPTALNSDQLSTVKLSDLSSELLYLKNEIKVKEGNNNINAILKHQFSEVYTTITINQTAHLAGSKINSIQNPKIAPA